MEIWKDIPLCAGYQINKSAQVRNKKTLRVLTPFFIRQYHAVRMNGTNYLVHQLLAIAYLGHNPQGNRSVVDHIDNNPLNNSLENLQIISHRQNLSKDKKNKSSKYTGVCWDKKRGKWIAQIRDNKKVIYLGGYLDEYEAHLAYQKKLKELTR